MRQQTVNGKTRPVAVFRTNRNRKLSWYGAYSQSGKSVKCYTSSRLPVYISIETGISGPEQILHADERINLQMLRAAIAQAEDSNPESEDEQ